MLAVRNLIKANNQILKNVAQQRNMSVILTPSRNKVSKGDQILLASAKVLVIDWSIVPTWVLINIKNYRHDE